MFIYRITNIITKKSYIGKTTKSIDERFQRHKYNAKYGSKTHLHRSMRKHGCDNFIIETIEQTENLNEREQYWISTLSPEYNMTTGGEGCDPLSSPNFIDAMKKHHASRTKDSYATFGMLGKSHSSNTKSKISRKNSYPVSCNGVVYQSIKEAEQALPNIKIRYRLDSPKYPHFFRLRDKRVYPTKIT
jgi:group I intron endonuclease